MARFYHALNSDGRFCNRCKNRCQLFGSRDPETGWEGWCCVCNLTWRICKYETTIKACSREHSQNMLRAMGRKCSSERIIRIFIGVMPEGPDYMQGLRLYKHKIRVLQLSWLSAPVEWWYESDSEGELDRVLRPRLRTLYEITMTSPAFLFQCIQEAAYVRRDLGFGEPLTLLDAVVSYIHPPPRWMGERVWMCDCRMNPMHLIDL